MTHHAISLFRRLLGDERGSPVVLVVAALVALVGARARGRRRPFLDARSVVQASANASGLAAAQDSALAGRRSPRRRHTAA